jgi:hypothetical protein
MSAQEEGKKRLRIDLCNRLKKSGSGSSKKQYVATKSLFPGFVLASATEFPQVMRLRKLVRQKNSWGVSKKE